MTPPRKTLSPDRVEPRQVIPIHDPDACPVRYVLDRIGDTWSLVTLIALSDGPLRYMALLRTIDGVTRRMLTRTLRALEQDGLIHRSEAETVPPAVTYTLTGRGASLVDSLAPLIRWSHDNGLAMRTDAQRAHPGPAR